MNGLLPGGQAVVLWAPLAVLAITSLAVLAADAVSGSLAGVRIGIGGLTVAVVCEVVSAARPTAVAGGGALLLGGSRATVTAIVVVIAALALFAGYRLLSAQPHGGQVAALIVFSAIGCATLISAADLAMLAVSLEMLALSAYALVSASRHARADEASAKYFVQGAVATGLMVYGMAVLFGVYGGQTGYAELGRTLATSAPVAPAVTGMVLLLAALAFKLGAFPFHSWAPDAYETASAPVAAFLAAAPKLAALAAAGVLTLRVFGGQTAVLVPLMVGLSIASIAFGNLGGLRQVSYQRMLAYSGIAQIGYALAAFSGGAAGLTPALVLGSAYALAAAGAFMAGQAVRADSPSWDGTIGGMAGLGRRRPLLAGSLAVCLLSLTGIPLTAGFWGKLFAFGVAARVAVEPALRPDSQAWIYWTVLLAGVIGSVVSFGYYGGVLRAVYLDGGDAEARIPERGTEDMEPQPDPLPAAAEEQVRPAVAATALVALVVLVMGVAPLIFGPSWLIAAFSGW